MSGPKRRRKFKLSIESATMHPEDRLMLMNKYRHLKELHKHAAKAPQDIKQLFQQEINSLRADLLNNYAHKFFIATIHLGPHKYTEEFPFYPGFGTSTRTEEIRVMRDTLVKQLAKKRVGNKEVYRTLREFNGMQYHMLGGSRNKKIPYDIAPRPILTVDGVTGRPAQPEPKKPEVKKIFGSMEGGGMVFETPGAILKLMNSPEYAGRIHRPKKPYTKDNYVGVELELICSMNADRLREAFIAAKLSGSVYVMRDGSIRPEKDGEYTHEVTLIAKQEHVNDIVSKVCKVLQSKEVNAYVNNSCGLHVHLDMRSRKPEIAYQNLYYSLGILARMVPPDRVDSEWGKRYCALNTSPEWGNGGNSPNGRRYSAINCDSYGKHRTIEVRLHSGSLNPTKINNWVNLLVSLVERKTTVGMHMMVPEDVQKHFGIDDKLVEYIKMRTEKFKNRSLDTRKDHFETAI